MTKAYWFKNNKLIEVGKIKYKNELKNSAEGGKTHIHDLVENPEIFGLTDSEIENTYKKYNEKVGNEGKAREEIIKKVMENGWIRVRYHDLKRNDYWIIQFDDFKKRKNALQDLVAKLMLDLKVITKYSPVVLNDLHGYFVKYDGYSNPNNSITTFLEGAAKKPVEVIKEYKQFKIFDY